MAVLICVLASDNIPIEALSGTISSAVLEVRKSRVRTKFINIVFYGRDAKNVFKYRDVFTRYIDIGVRVYIENRPSQIEKILALCSIVYAANEDRIVEELSTKINANIKRV